jgi:hypothetical protein
MTLAPATIRATASFDTRSGQAERFEFSGALPRPSDKADAVAFAASLPKAAGFKGTTLGTYDGTPGQADYDRYEVGYVFCYGVLISNGNNGGVNETGLRRFRAAMRALEAAGITVEWTAPCVNSYPTLAEFLAAVA